MKCSNVIENIDGTLRLDLVRLDMNGQSNSGLTTQLELVRDMAYRVDAEAELRAYLAQSTPTPVSRPSRT